MKDAVELALQGHSKEAFDVILGGSSLNLQYKTVWEIKVQWARDVLTFLTKMVKQFPGRTTIQNIEGGNAPHTIINGYDASDMEWELRVELSWRDTVLEGEVRFDHPMRGRMVKDFKFNERVDGMKVAQPLFKVMKEFVGTR